MRKTAKRGNFRKRHNKTRRQRGGADFTHLLDTDYIYEQAHDNKRYLMDNLVGDRKMVSVTDSMDGSSGSAAQNWFATALFYSAIMSVSGDIKVYGNDVNEKKLLYWIRKNFFPNKRRFFRKITDVKLELVEARELMPEYKFNADRDTTTGHWKG